MPDDSIWILRRFDECLRLTLSKGYFLFLRAKGTELSLRRVMGNGKNGFCPKKDESLPARKRRSFLLVKYVFSWFASFCLFLAAP